MATFLEIQSPGYDLNIDKCPQHEHCTILSLIDEYANEFHASPAALHEIIKVLVEREKKVWQQT